MAKALSIAQIMENEFAYFSELFELFEKDGGKPCNSEIWDKIEKKGIETKEKYKNKLSNKNLNKIYNDFSFELFFNRFHSVISLLQEKFSKSSSLDELYTYKDITNDVYYQYRDKLDFNDDRIQYLYNVTNFIYQSNKWRILNNIVKE